MQQAHGWNTTAWLLRARNVLYISCAGKLWWKKPHKTRRWCSWKAPVKCFLSGCNPKPLSFWFIKWWRLKDEFLCSHHPVYSLNSICETWCLLSEWDLFLPTPLEIHDVTFLLPKHINTFPWLLSLEMYFSGSQYWLFILCLLWNMFLLCASPMECTGISIYSFSKGKPLWRAEFDIFWPQEGMGVHCCPTAWDCFSRLHGCSLVSSSKGVGMGWGPVWQRVQRIKPLVTVGERRSVYQAPGRRLAGHGSQPFMQWYSLIQKQISLVMYV